MYVIQTHCVRNRIRFKGPCDPDENSPSFATLELCRWPSQSGEISS